MWKNWGVWEIPGVKVWDLPLKRLVTLTTVLRYRTAGDFETRSRTVFLLSFITDLWTSANVALMILTPSQQTVPSRLACTKGKRLVSIQREESMQQTQLTRATQQPRWRRCLFLRGLRCVIGVCCVTVVRCVALLRPNFSSAKGQVKHWSHFHIISEHNVSIWVAYMQMHFHTTQYVIA